MADNAADLAAAPAASQAASPRASSGGMATPSPVSPSSGGVIESWLAAAPRTSFSGWGASSDPVSIAQRHITCVFAALLV
jgi:hypothetical protein